MPSDIRSFFGGRPPAPPKTEPETKKPAAKKGRASRKIVTDSDEEEPAPKLTKVSPKEPAKRPTTPEGEATTTSDYFANSKPKRSEPVRTQSSTGVNGTSESKTPVKTNGTTNGAAKPSVKTPVKTETTPSKATPASRRSSARGKSQKSYADDLDEDDFPDDLSEEGFEDMARPTASSKKTATTSRNNTAKSTPASSRSKRVKKEDVDYDEDDDVKMENADDDFVVPDDEDGDVKSKAKGGKKSAGTKRKAKELDDEEDDDDTPKKRGRKGSASTSSRKAKKEPEEDSSAMQDLLNSIPTIRPPTPPPRGDDGKFKFTAGNANLQPPPGAGSKEIPEGEPNCLAGQTFVFTGVLETLSRDDGVALVKKLGGKVMSAPSKNTKWVVLGTDAGPSKLKKIRENGLRTIDEEGLFDMIRKLPANGGDSKAAAAAAEKQAKDEDKIRKQAIKEEQEEKKAMAAEKAAQKARGKEVNNSVDSRLWTVKYAPTQVGQVVGNKSQVEKLQTWLRDFPKNQRTGFKLPGKNGSGTFRAVIIHGPPGIGKTTAAHLVAKVEGYDVVESNASDTRSKKLVETGLKGVLDTRSLLGYFAGDGKDVEASKRKLCLIMDEVDGMSAGDRGGVGAMAAVIKKSSIPIILICNERRQPKMKPFDHVAFDMPFRRPTSEMIRARMSTIMFREGMKMPAPALNAIIEGTGADIRQVVNMISTAKLDEADMEFADGQQMSKAWEKHVILKPWDINQKILGSGMFHKSSKATLNDKTELYFNDHELSYLMLQENYLNTKMALVEDTKTPKQRTLKTMQLASRAADSISDGDLVDRMIHGSQQQWSLMPTHAVFSFVRPASYVWGSMGYSERARFPSWLGQNSAQGKLTRYIKEIQGHMRLRMTGDRHDVRQQYVPLLWKELVYRLQTEGKEAVDEIIELMDSYFLTKEDFDAIVELGVGPHNQDDVKIPSLDKAAFTREYNKREHPLPFIKASSVQAPKKLGKDKPDLEEAIEESDEEEVVNVKDEDDDEDLDLSKDKYVKQPKKKKAAPTTKGKGKKAKADEEDDDEEEEKPKKGKGKAAAKGKGKK